MLPFVVRTGQMEIFGENYKQEGQGSPFQDSFEQNENLDGGKQSKV